MCLDFPQKWHTQAGLPYILSLEKVDTLGLDCWSGPCVAWITKPNYSSKPSVSEVMSETVKPPVSEVVKPIEVS